MIITTGRAKAVKIQVSSKWVEIPLLIKEPLKSLNCKVLSTYLLRVYCLRSGVALASLKNSGHLPSLSEPLIIEVIWVLKKSDYCITRMLVNRAWLFGGIYNHLGNLVLFNTRKCRKRRSNIMAMCWGK